jgi:predicted transcriptional regulator
MKIKSEWVIHRFLRAKSKLGDDVIVHTTRPSGRNGEFFYRGMVTEEQIKEILSNKQFQKWKRGESSEFVKHFTVEQRKHILKLNNKKK